MPPTIDNNQAQEGSAGPVVAIIVVLAVIILGGLYFWGARSEMTGEYSPTSAVTEQSQSDELDSIESDLFDTSVDNLGEDL